MATLRSIARGAEVSSVSNGADAVNSILNNSFSVRTPLRTSPSPFSPFESADVPSDVIDDEEGAALALRAHLHTTTKS